MRRFSEEKISPCLSLRLTFICPQYFQDLELILRHLKSNSPSLRTRKIGRTSHNFLN